MNKGKKINDYPVKKNPDKAVRLTFRIDQDVVAEFKAIAALRKMKVEELGKQALLNIIKKEKQTVKNWQENI